jgi:hypothetical protein
MTLLKAILAMVLALGAFSATFSAVDAVPRPGCFPCSN